MSTRATRFESLGVVVAPPAGWTDASIAAFTRDEINLVIMREPIRADDSLRTHAMRRVARLGRELVAFELIQTGESLLGGRLTVVARFTTLAECGPLEQEMHFVETTRDGARAVTVITTTMPGERESADTAAMRAMLDAAVHGVSFDDAPYAEPAPAERRPTSGFVRAPEIPMPGSGRGRRSA